MKAFKKLNAFNVLLWSASFAIIAGSIVAIITIFGPVDVLKNWNTSVGGANKTFVAGQTVYFESESEKLLSIPGTVDRQLICDAKGALIEREISIDTIDTKQPAGVNPLRKNALTMPGAEAFKDQQGNQTLPRVCRIHFNACYWGVYGFRELCEQSETEKFTVVETTPQNVNTDNSADISDIPNTVNQTITQIETVQTPVTNNTTIEAEAPECAVDVNLLGLLPVKLICQ